MRILLNDADADKQADDATMQGLRDTLAATEHTLARAQQDARNEPAIAVLADLSESIKANTLATTGLQEWLGTNPQQGGPAAAQAREPTAVTSYTAQMDTELGDLARDFVAVLPAGR